MAPKAVVAVTCVVCGDVRRHDIDYDNDDDVAAIGIDIAEALRHGHIVMAVALDNHKLMEVLN